MEKSYVLQQLTAVGVVPVLRAASAESALRTVEALMEGGIPVAEITMTVPSAVQVIARCRAQFGDRLMVGAGSVTDTATCAEAIAAGSHFVVTPALRTSVIEMCRQKNCLVIAGALTPTEILDAWEAGADAVKVFPAKAMGGAAYLCMVREPLPHIPLVPTGGVTLETLADYFKAGAPFVGAGTDLVAKCDPDRFDPEAVIARARQYVAQIRLARGVGI